MSAEEQGFKFVVPYKISPRPEWVSEVQAEAASAADSPFVYTLLDYQVRVLENSVESFKRTRVKILDESVVEDLSQHLFDVVPGSQSMVFHRCEILRDDQTLDCLDQDNIRCMQRETDLERHISTEELTVELIVDDLRVGDTLLLESSFVETGGEHPLYGKSFRRSYRLSWSCPVAVQSIRLLNESCKDVAIQHLDSANEIDKTTFVEPNGSFEQKLNNPVPEKSRGSMPVDYWPPCLMISTRAQWNVISSSLHSFYGDVGAINGKLDLSTIDDLDIQQADDESIINCIRFVQNNIRYRSESGGIFSHTPKAPEKTLKRRTGDCKDKSNLLAAMLTSIGVEANLALVNTSLHNGIESLQPSPFLFDHMIVQFVWKGKTYYVDATVQKQAGGLEHLDVVRYKKALPITADGNGLVDIAFDNTKEVFSLTHLIDFRKSAGDKPVVEIKRKFSGRRANNMRYHYASSQMSLLGESYRESSEDELDVKLSSVSALEITEDDQVHNTLSTREVYAIETPLNEIEHGKLAISTGFNDDVRMPSKNEMPVEIEIDGIAKHHIHVRYDIKPETEPDIFECKTDWYDYRDEITIQGTDLHFQMQLKPGVSQLVPVAELDACRAKSNSINERSVSRFPVEIASTADMLGYLAMPALLLGVGVAVLSGKTLLAMILCLSFVYSAKNHFGKN